MNVVTLIAGAALVAAPVTAQAANADHPYQNIDRSNDAGNNTGDSQVDRLNQTQLDSNGVPASSYGYAAPPVSYSPSPYPYTAPSYAPPPQRYYGGY